MLSTANNFLKCNHTNQKYLIVGLRLMYNTVLIKKPYYSRFTPRDNVYCYRYRQQTSASSQRYRNILKSGA